jgi:mono/diheme cytochrome c family protein
MVTLKTLTAERALEPARPELVAAPPRVQASDARTRSVLGYLSTNCGSCHNQESSIANLGLTLKPSSPRDLDKMTSKWQIPKAAEGESRYVTPGSPELSAILVRMKSRRPSSQMPPLGTVLHDKEAIALVTEWVSALPSRW